MIKAPHHPKRTENYRKQRQQKIVKGENSLKRRKEWAVKIAKEMKR